jgi:hypothetical protein
MLILSSLGNGFRPSCDVTEGLRPPPATSPKSELKNIVIMAHVLFGFGGGWEGVAPNRLTIHPRLWYHSPAKNQPRAGFQFSRRRV